MQTYVTTGVCSTAIHFEIKDGIISKVEFDGGCDGNLKGVCMLAANRKVEEVITLLAGITCDDKATSCPDQLAKALSEAY